MAISSPNDSSRIARLQNRDPKALSEIYDHFGRKIFFLIYRIVGDHGATEDLVQETFIRIWNGAHLINTSQGSLLSWVMAIARNRAIDYVRSAHGRQRSHLQPLDWRVPSLFPEHEMLLIRSDRARRLQETFAQLPPQQREMIKLAFYQGLTHMEMAARLNKPLGTVKTSVRKALITLREKLAGGPLDPATLRK